MADTLLPSESNELFSKHIICYSSGVQIGTGIKVESLKEKVVGIRLQKNKTFKPFVYSLNPW